jgi:hypothetical protein
LKDWKLSAIIAAFAFFFSFIAGVLGSVSFGIILFRALFGAVIFGAIGFGISFLLRRYLPEIFESDSHMESEDFVKESDLNENQSEITSSTELTGEMQGIDISIGDEEQKVDSESALEEDMSVNQEGELVEEMHESIGSASMDSVPANIDVLPDMGAFSGSFENTEDTDGNGSGKTGAVTLDIMGEEQDPELVAKALRTMVKKDQEG